jgi:hypothetical protein
VGRRWDGEGSQNGSRERRRNRRKSPKSASPRQRRREEEVSMRVPGHRIYEFRPSRTRRRHRKRGGNEDGWGWTHPYRRAGRRQSR